MNVVGRRRRGPRCRVVSIHNTVNKYKHLNKNNKRTVLQGAIHKTENNYPQTQVGTGYLSMVLRDNDRQLPLIGNHTRPNTEIQCLAKVFGPLELCDLLPHFRLQT